MGRGCDVIDLVGGDILMQVQNNKPTNKQTCHQKYKQTHKQTKIMLLPWLEENAGVKFSLPYE